MPEQQYAWITEWLTQPYRLDMHQQQQVNELLEQYPYLVPARMMKAAAAFPEKGFDQVLLEESQLFMGNWLYFHEMMEGSVKERFQQEEHQEETEAKQTVGVHAATTPDEAGVDELVQPLYVENYFQHQGIEVPDTLPADIDREQQETDEKSLMVMMGFDEWLQFLKKKSDRKKSEEEDKAALRSIWQREKLAAAIGEEDDNIPEAVFEMAINSIDKQDIMVSESLAEIHAKQGKYDKAIEIYRKLSLQNPEKKTYFAAKINYLNKEKLS